MLQETVSVVIPSYNYGRYVVGAVDSALAQTHAPLEVIVVDDGSTDDTRQRLEPYADRIRYIHQKNQGLPAARNTGIRAARGRWVALLDADDLWHRQKTEVQLSALRQFPDAGLIGGLTADDLSGPLPEDPPSRLVSVRDLLLKAPLGPSSALVRRDCFDEVGDFDETLTSVEDRDMWLRLARRFPVVLVESPCYWYRYHGGQMSRNAMRMHTNYRRVLDKFFADDAACAEHRGVAYSYLYYDTSWCLLMEGSRWKALAMLARSFWRSPGPVTGGPRPKRLPRVKLTLRALLGERLFRTFARAPERPADAGREPEPEPVAPRGALAQR
jgi:glycosyltransferase involved in cell wall biosynthesis